MIPIAVCKVQAGFPSPADDYLESSLSIDEYLIENKPASFFVKVTGHSMHAAGIYENDIAVVNRALTAKSGDIVIGVIDNEFLIKELIMDGNKAWLVPHHSDYPKIPLRENKGDSIWGVVTGIVRKYQ